MWTDGGLGRIREGTVEYQAFSQVLILDFACPSSGGRSGLKSEDVIFPTLRSVKRHPSLLPQCPALTPFLIPNSGSSHLRPKIVSTVDYTTASSCALIATEEKTRRTPSSSRSEVAVIVGKRSGGHRCLVRSHMATGGGLRCVRKFSGERLMYGGSR